jgi:hypothetical protein
MSCGIVGRGRVEVDSGVEKRSWERGVVLVVVAAVLNPQSV